jgi:hypothetical protein
MRATVLLHFGPVRLVSENKVQKGMSKDLLPLLHCTLLGEAKETPDLI